MKRGDHVKSKMSEHSRKSGIPGYFIYPFFMVHMLMFGLSGFLMAYATENPPLAFIYAHGGIAIFVYIVFYLVFFGFDEVKWMFINAGLGALGIYTQIGWMLSLFGKNISDYPKYVHATPFLYFVLYTFLWRHALLDLFKARDDEARKKQLETVYIFGSVAVYLTTYLLT